MLQLSSRSKSRVKVETVWQGGFTFCLCPGITSSWNVKSQVQISVVKKIRCFLSFGWHQLCFLWPTPLFTPLPNPLFWQPFGSDESRKFAKSHSFLIFWILCPRHELKGRILESKTMYINTMRKLIVFLHTINIWRLQHFFTSPEGFWNCESSGREEGVLCWGVANSWEIFSPDVGDRDFSVCYWLCRMCLQTLWICLEILQLIMHPWKVCH